MFIFSTFVWISKLLGVPKHIELFAPIYVSISMYAFLFLFCPCYKSLKSLSIQMIFYSFMFFWLIVKLSIISYVLCPLFFLFYVFYPLPFITELEGLICLHISLFYCFVKFLYILWILNFNLVMVYKFLNLLVWDFFLFILCLVFLMEKGLKY